VESTKRLAHGRRSERHTQARVFDLWDTYEKVVVKDFMFHAALGEEVERALRERFEGRAFSARSRLWRCACLCHDSAPDLRRRVTVIDLSDTAARAAENLKSLPCPVQCCSDMLSALSGGVSYDVLHSSFVLHHLSTEDKAEFFRRASVRSRPAACCCWSTRCARKTKRAMTICGIISPGSRRIDRPFAS
jgi:hypothetical protein